VLNVDALNAPPRELNHGPNAAASALDAWWKVAGSHRASLLSSTRGCWAMTWPQLPPRHGTKRKAPETHKTNHKHAHSTHPPPTMYARTLSRRVAGTSALILGSCVGVSTGGSRCTGQHADAASARSAPSVLSQPVVSRRGGGGGAVEMNPVVIAISVRQESTTPCSSCSLPQMKESPSSAACLQCAAGVIVPTILFMALRSSRRAERVRTSCCTGYLADRSDGGFLSCFAHSFL